MSKDIKDEELYSQLYNIIQSAVRNEVERAMQEKDDKAQHDITQDNKITKASEKQVDSYIIGGETEEDAVTNDFYIDEYEEAVEEEQLIFNKMLEYYTESHRKNKKRIRVGMICMIVIPLIFLMLMFTMNSSKIVYLVFWIISLFALCTYLIAVEYMDYNLQERMKELGVTSHKKKEAIIGPKVIGQDIENLKERIGLQSFYFRLEKNK